MSKKAILIFAAASIMGLIFINQSPVAEEKPQSNKVVTVSDIAGLDETLSFQVPNRATIIEANKGRPVEHVLDLEIQSFLKVQIDDYAAEVVSFPIDYDVQPVDILRLYFASQGFESEAAGTLADDQRVFAYLDYFVGENNDRSLRSYATISHDRVYLFMGSDADANELVEFLAVNSEMPNYSNAPIDKQKTVVIDDREFRIAKELYSSNYEEGNAKITIISNAKNAEESSIILTVETGFEISHKDHKSRFIEVLESYNISHSENWDDGTEVTFDLQTKNGLRFAGKLYTGKNARVSLIYPNYIEDPGVALRGSYYYTEAVQQFAKVR